MSESEKKQKPSKVPSCIIPSNCLNFIECQAEVKQLSDELVLLTHVVEKSHDSFKLIHKLISKRFSELNDRQCYLLANSHKE